MVRLLVAANLPDECRERLLAVLPASLPGVCLVGREEMHLTLHFIGEVKDDQITAIRGALEKATVPPFTIDLEGVGRFPAEGDARVLWVGVRLSPELSALHRAVALALAAVIGFSPEKRPYHPHITLARLDDVSPQAAVEDYLREHAAFRLASVPITRFSLYSSDLAPSGPRYQVEATVELPSLHLVYLNDGGMFLTKKCYRDWREIQDEYNNYLTSLGPWSEAEVTEFLEFEYPALTQVAERVRSFVHSDAEVFFPLIWS